MFTTLSILNTGFSIVIAAMLFTIYLFFTPETRKSPITIVSCAALLLGLSCLQFAHFEFFLNNTNLLDTLYYRFLIFLVPPMFYFFSYSILFPEPGIQKQGLLHLIPLATVFFLPREIAVPIAFLIGTGYCFWLLNIVYRLRTHRKRYGIELFFFGFFLLLAVIVLILGFSVSYVDSAYFYYFYANGISLAYILVTASLIIFPNLLAELNEAITLSYSASTLKNTNVEACISKLKKLMEEEGLYQNENLNLSSLAEAMGLSSHQLSELINTQFGISLSKYIREQRVEKAKQLLIEEPDTSILSISMETGFKSQSNFYTAFKEITGQSPGHYRKNPPS